MKKVKSSQASISINSCTHSFSLWVSHCVKSVRIRSFSGPHYPVFSENEGKCGPE